MNDVEKNQIVGYLKKIILRDGENDTSDYERQL